MRELERRVVLSVIDRRWRDHLYEMDYLKDGIGLRAMAQRDPLVEYQREGFALFQNMMGADPRGVGRLPVQPRGRGAASPPRARAAGDEVEAKGLGAHARSRASELQYSAAQRRRRGRGAQPARPGPAGGDQRAPPGRGIRALRRRAGGRGAARSVRPADGCRRTARGRAEPRPAPRAADKKK